LNAFVRFEIFDCGLAGFWDILIKAVRGRIAADVRTIFQSGRSAYSPWNSVNPCWARSFVRLSLTDHSRLQWERPFVVCRHSTNNYWHVLFIFTRWKEKPMEKSGQHGFTTSWIICTSWIYSDPGENTFLTIDYPVLCKKLVHRIFSKNICIDF
jgi:hypothetical protein